MTRLPSRAPSAKQKAGLAVEARRQQRCAVDLPGRTVDVHGMRHTFAALLARKGLTPGPAQKLVRHSDIRLTMNTYTDPVLLDVGAAVDALPAFSGDRAVTLAARDA